MERMLAWYVLHIVDLGLGCSLTVSSCTAWCEIPNRVILDSQFSIFGDTVKWEMAWNRHGDIMRNET